MILIRKLESGITMASLDINYANLSIDCNDNLKTAIRGLNNVVLKLNNLYIPYGCKKAEILKIKSDIVRYKNKLETIREWIEDSNRDFSSSCSECELRIARLPNVRFGERK